MTIQKVMDIVEDYCPMVLMQDCRCVFAWSANSKKKKSFSHKQKNYKTIIK